jgi:glyoxylase-like metal-dependent hydrolase (beta-lactamase superfamily II)
MLAGYAVAISLVLPLSGIAVAQDAKAIVAAGGKAMGIQDLNALGSVLYSGGGASYLLGESKAPGSGWVKSQLSKYTRVIDFDGAGSWEEMVRPGETANENGDPQIETRRIPFAEAYSKVGRQFDIWLTPVGFLKGALLHDAAAKTVTVGGRQSTAVSFVSDKKYTITGYFDQQNFLERVETRIDDPAVGDMPVEAVYSDYKDFQHGMVFPSHIAIKEDGQPVLELTIDNANRNVVKFVGELLYNQVNKGNPEYRGNLLGKAPPIFVDQILYGDSVYDFTVKDAAGEVHHTVLVEFNDYLVAIEAPLDEEHASAVIAEIRKIFGSKPIRYVVNTHAHFTEVGGLRTYAAEGATIITHEENKAWLENALDRPRNIQPDKLSRIKKKILIETVAEKRVLTDGAHTLELHHVQNGRVDGLLIAYVPAQKLVVEADLFTVKSPRVEIDADGHAVSLPYPPDVRYAGSLIEALNRLKLEYKIVLCLQGRAAPKSELLGEVAKAGFGRKQMPRAP